MTNDEDKIKRVAEACYESIRILHDDDIVPWFYATESQKTGLVARICALAEGRPLEAQHVGWCETMREQGWTRGAILDQEAKTHPHLVPYRELPARRKREDWLVAHVAYAMAQLVGSPGTELEFAL